MTQLGRQTRGGHTMSSNQRRAQQVSGVKQRGMAAELADILDQLDDASRLADEIDTSHFMH